MVMTNSHKVLILGDNMIIACIYCIWKQLQTAKRKKTNASAIKLFTQYLEIIHRNKDQKTVWTNRLTVDVAVIGVQRGWGHTPGNKYCMAGMLTYKEKLRQSTEQVLNKSWKGWLKVMNATGRKTEQRQEVKQTGMVETLTRVDGSRHNNGFCSRRIRTI